MCAFVQDGDLATASHAETSFGANAAPHDQDACEEPRHGNNDLPKATTASDARDGVAAHGEEEHPELEEDPDGKPVVPLSRYMEVLVAHVKELLIAYGLKQDLLDHFKLQLGLETYQLWTGETTEPSRNERERRYVVLTELMVHKFKNMYNVRATCSCVVWDECFKIKPFFVSLILFISSV